MEALGQPPFVALPENRSARVALRHVAASVRRQRPAETTSVLVCGSTGVGKSRLMEHLQHVCRNHVVVRISAEQPDDALLAGRTAELLIIEDIQYWPKGSLHALASLLDQRAARRLPTVATANEAPARLALPSLILSRLANGLIVWIDPPNERSRGRLLQRFAIEMKRRPSAAQIEAIAAQPFTSVRQLLAAMLQSRVDGAANEILLTDNDCVEPRILKLVSEEFRVSVSAMMGADRRPNVTLARHVAMYLLRRYTNSSLSDLGRKFGRRDESSIRHACQKLAKVKENNTKLAGIIETIERRLPTLREKPSTVGHYGVLVRSQHGNGEVVV